MALGATAACCFPWFVGSSWVTTVERRSKAEREDLEAQVQTLKLMLEEVRKQVFDMSRRSAAAPRDNPRTAILLNEIRRVQAQRRVEHAESALSTS